MSLDVWLTLEGHKSNDDGSGIFVRENGRTREISRAEWEEKFPNLEPVITKNQEGDNVVFEYNITHNLGKMASKAGIYTYLWQPDELGITKAGDLVYALEVGLNVLKSDPERFEVYNPSNGWGSYEGLVEFTTKYLKACQNYPDATISISR